MFAAEAATLAACCEFFHRNSAVLVERDSAIHWREVFSGNFCLGLILVHNNLRSPISNLKSPHSDLQYSASDNLQAVTIAFSQTDW